MRRATRSGWDEARYAVLGLLAIVSPAAQVRRDAAQSARTLRDLQALRGFLANRPGLRLQITGAGRVDGAGGQALSVISALAFAHNHDCRYLHTPFRTVAHAPGDAMLWARRWEEFFGFGRGETLVPADSEVVPLRRFVQLTRRNPRYVPGPRIVVAAPSFRYAEMARLETRRHLMPILRAKYYSSDKSTLPIFRADGAVNVAVHLRRGDVGPRDPRYARDAPVLNAIAQVRSVLASIGRAATINLFSEGTPDQFRQYRAVGCELHLGGDPFAAFHNLVAADVLVTTDSAFSRAAAMLSDGIAINPTDKWGAGERWLARSPDGSFDTAQLATLLRALNPA